MHRRDSVAVLAPSLGRHPDPRVAHPERLEDFFANVLAIRAAVSGYAAHDFSKQIPRRRNVVTGRLPYDPSRLDSRVANLRDDAVPRVRSPRTDCRAKASGMRQHVANRDAVLALGAERRDVFRDAIIERNFSALPDLGEGDYGDRLGRRHPEHDGVGGHRDAIARHSERKIGDGLAFERNIKLRADMEPALDARFDCPARALKLHRTSLGRRADSWQHWGARTNLRAGERSCSNA